MAKKILQYLLSGFLGFVFLLAMLFISLQVELSRSLWVELAKNQVQSMGMQLELDGIEGIFPIDFNFKQLQIKDEDGIWLQLQGVQFNWSPMALFSGEIKIKDFTVDALNLSRLPSQFNAQNSSSNNSTQESEPSFIKAIKLERLEFKTIHLGAELLDLAQHKQDLRFAVFAQGELNPKFNLAKLVLKVPQLQWQNGKNSYKFNSTVNSVNLEIDFNPLKKHLKLFSQININQDFIAPFMAADSIEPGNIKLNLDGDAPLLDWHGNLAFEASQLTALEAQLSIMQQNSQAYALQVDSQIKIKPELLLQYGLSKKLSDIALITQIDYANNRLMINKLSIDSFLAKITNRGEVDLSEESIQLSSTIQVPELAKVPLLLTSKTLHDTETEKNKSLADLAGNALLEIDAKGKLNKPQIAFKLFTEKIFLDGLSIPKSTAIGNLTLDTNSKEAKISIQAEGNIEELHLAAAKHIPAQHIHWQLAAQQNQFPLVQLEHFKIDSEIFRIALNGHIDTQALQGKMHLDSSFKDLSVLTGNEAIKGRKHMTADMLIHPNAQHIEFDLNGHLEQFQGLDAAEILFGARPQWQAKLAIKEQNQLTLEEFQLDGQQLQLNAQAQIALDSGAVSAVVNSSISSLNELGQSLDKVMQGQLDSHLSLSGNMDNPQIKLLLSGEQLVFEQLALENLNLVSEVQDINQNPQGKVQISLGPKQHQIQLNSSFQLLGQALNLSDIQFVAPQSSITGQLKYDLDKAIAIGDLRGQLQQLAALQFWHQQEQLDGPVDFELSLKGEDDQDLDFKVHSDWLNFSETQLKQLELTAHLHSLNQQQSIQSSLNIKEVHQGVNNLGKLSLDIQGQPEKLDIGLQVKNSVQDLYLNLKAQVLQNKNQLLVLMNQLDGKALKQSFRLEEKAQFSLTDKHIKLSPVSLNYGQANMLMQGSALLGEEQNQPSIIDIRLDVTQFSLDTLNLLGSDLTGQADAHILLRGTLQQPIVDSQIQLEKFGLQGKDFPFLDMQLEAGLKQQKLNANLSIGGLSKQAIKASAYAPLKLSLQPFEFDFNEQSPIKADLQANMNLNHLVNWLNLDQQLVEGQLNTDLNVQGSLLKPSLNGSIVLQNGKYENAEMGTIINNIVLNTRVKNNQLLIESLTADDGDKGKITAQGQLDLLANQAIPFQFSLNLDKTRLLRQDNLSIQLSGDIAFQGDKQTGQLAGNIKVEQGEFYLPEGSSADIPELQVTELNQQQAGESIIPQSSNNGYPVDLNLGINIPAKFYVRGRGLESEWKGDLKVSGNSIEPLLLGFLEVERGYFNFLSHRFNFREGKIDFLGTVPPKPRLNFDMSARGKEVLAIIKLSGSTDKLNLRLESEPMLPQDEILARLLFDKELSDISGFQALQLASAVRTLTTGGTGLMDETRNSLGIDTLDFNGDEVSGNSVKAGKYIREDVFVEVESGMSSGSSKVRVEMNLNPHISVDSTVDQESNTGFGLNWKLDY